MPLRRRPSGLYTILLKSLADASVSATTPPFQLSGGQLFLASPGATSSPQEVYVLLGQAIPINISVAGGNLLSGSSLSIFLWYYGCCNYQTLTPSFVATRPTNNTFWWTPSGIMNPFSQYQIRVVSNSDPTVTFVSNYFSVSVGRLSIVSPAPAAGVVVGSTLNVTWSALGPSLISSSVSIALYPVGSTVPLAVLTNSVPTSSYTFLWATPSFLPTGPVNVVVLCTSDSAATATSTFSLVPFVPFTGLSISSPGVGSVWFLGQSASVTWGGFGSVMQGSVAVRLMYGGIVVANISASIAASAQTVSWTVPGSLLALSNYYSVGVYSLPSGNVSIMSAPLTMQVAPSAGLVLSLPVNGSRVCTNSPLNVSYAGFGASVMASTVRVFIQRTSRASPALNISAASPGAGGLVTWNFFNKTNLVHYEWYSVSACSDADMAVCSTSLVQAIFNPSYGVTLTAPLSGQTWYRGMPCVITWAAFSPYIRGSPVRIDFLSSPSNIAIAVAAASVPATDGSFVWLLPPSLPSGSYVVKVTSLYDTTQFSLSDIVTVLNGAIMVTNPPSNLPQQPVYSLVNNFQMNITWLSFGASTAASTFSIFLWYYGCCNYQTLTTTATSSPFLWTPSGIMNPFSQYQIRVVSNADNSVAFTTGYFSVSVGNLSLVVPTPTTMWTLGGTGNITWSGNGPSLTSGSLWAQLWDSTGTTQLTTITSSVSFTPSTFMYTVPSTLAVASNQVQLRLGSTADSNVRVLLNFLVSSQGLVVLSPSASSQWVPSAVVNISWSSYGTTVPSGTLTITLTVSTGGGPVTYTVTSTSPCAAGFFLYTVPAGVALNVQSYVTITSNAVGSVTATSPNFYTRTGALTLTVPPFFVKGDNVTVRWTAVGSAVLASTATFSVMQGSTAYYSVPFTGATPAVAPLQLIWPVAGTIASGTYYLIMTSTADGLVTATSAPFTLASGALDFVRPSPLSSNNCPAINQQLVFRNGFSYNITWNVTGSVMKAGTVSIFVYYQTGSNWGTVSTSAPAGLGYYTWRMDNCCFQCNCAPW